MTRNTVYINEWLWAIPDYETSAPPSAGPWPHGQRFLPDLRPTPPTREQLLELERQRRRSQPPVASPRTSTSNSAAEIERGIEALRMTRRRGAATGRGAAAEPAEEVVVDADMDVDIDMDVDMDTDGQQAAEPEEEEGGGGGAQGESCDGGRAAAVDAAAAREDEKRRRSVAEAELATDFWRKLPSLSPRKESAAAAAQRDAALGQLQMRPGGTGRLHA